MNNVTKLPRRRRGKRKQGAPAEVVTLNMVTRLDLPVERVIQGLHDHKFARIIVIGELENGEFYFASNKADGPTVLWDLEAARAKLLKMGGVE